MSNTTFIDKQTVIQAPWAQDVNDAVYKAIGDGSLNPPTTPAQVRTNLGLPAAGGAALIGNTPAGTIASTTVQGAINEIVSDLAASSGSSLVGFIQAGTGAVARLEQDKGRERVTVADFGAVGDGVADDTAAINLALSSGAKTVQGIPGKTYLISHVGTKAAFDASGGAITITYCLEIPTGVVFDLNNSTLKLKTADTGIPITNKNTNSTTDTGIGLINGTIDGNSVDNGASTTWFYGVSKSKFDFIVKNAGRCGAVFYNCTQLDIPNYRVFDSKGAGAIFGGNTAQQGTKHQIGHLYAENVTAYDGVSLVGNSFVFGLTHSSIESVLGVNCDGGHKFTSNCDDINVGLSHYVTTAGGTNNCGTKLQGDAVAGTCKNITIGTVVSEGCVGGGLFVSYAVGCSIGTFKGYGNSTGSSNTDVQIDNSDISFGEIDSSNCTLSSVLATTSNLDIGVLKSTSCGTSGSLQYAIWTNTSGTGCNINIDELSVYDSRVTTGYNSYVRTQNAADNMIVGKLIISATQNSTFPFNITTGNVWLANVKLSPSALLAGEVTLTAGAGPTIVSNNNIRSNSSGGGFVQPYVTLQPINAAAAAFVGTGSVRPGGHATGQLKIQYGAAAAGTEKFFYRIEGYLFTTDASA